MQSTQKSDLRVCTWNVCLGARWKLSLIKNLLIENDIDILCVKEAGIKNEEDPLDSYQIVNWSRTGVSNSN